MTPKAKAKELFEKYRNMKLPEPIFGLLSNEAKECAYIAIDEILDSFENNISEPLNEVYQSLSTPQRISPITNSFRKYWQKVRKEIEKL